MISYNFKKPIVYFRSDGKKIKILDFYNIENLLFRIFYSIKRMIRIGKNRQILEMPFFTSLKMFDVSTETISIIDFYKVLRDAISNKSLFDVANINK